MKTMSLFIALAASTAANAKPLYLPEVNDRVGNGGFAYVCRDNQNKIISAQLLDLWEAEELKTHRSNIAVEKQIAAALKKMKAVSPNAGSFVAHALEVLQSSMVYVNRPLTRTEDAFPPYIPATGCAYEQVARYEPVLTETGTRGLRVYREIFDSPHFSNSDRAALFVHEAVYYLDRGSNKSTNSQRTRSIVAHLFSESKMPNAIRLTIGGLLGIEHRDGDNNPHRILALKNPARVGLELSFEEVDGLTGERLGDKSNLYRCQLIDLAGEGTVDTGWVTVDKIVGDYETVDENARDATKYKGYTSIPEFSPGRKPSEDGTGFANSVMTQCQKKGPDGKAVPVPFNVYVKFEDSVDCLDIERDGSVSTAHGEHCFVQTERSASSKFDFTLIGIEVVRGK